MAESKDIQTEQKIAGPRGAGLFETRTGYSLRSAPPNKHYASLYELIMSATGITVAIVVVARVLVPSLQGAGPIEPMMLAQTIALLSLAGLLLRNAARGLVRETQVDFELRQVRIVCRNSQNSARVEGVYPFDAIRSIFVRRSKHSSKAALCMRVKGDEMPVRLVGGTEDSLSAIHRRIVQDVNALEQPGPVARPRKVSVQLGGAAVAAE